MIAYSLQNESKAILFSQISVDNERRRDMREHRNYTTEYFFWFVCRTRFATYFFIRSTRRLTSKMRTRLTFRLVNKPQAFLLVFSDQKPPIARRSRFLPSLMTAVARVLGREALRICRFLTGETLGLQAFFWRVTFAAARLEAFLCCVI